LVALIVALDFDPAGQLAAGGRRYQDLHDALDGISPKVLTETLRRAERDGLIRRHLDSGG